MNLLLIFYRFWVRFRARFSLAEDSPRKHLFRRIGGTIFLITLGIAIIYLLIAIITGVDIIQPRSASAILRSTHPSSTYLWTDEAVHTFKVSGVQIREDWSIAVATDVKNNRYQLQFFNALPLEDGHPENNIYIFESDGKVSLRTTLLRQQAGDPWLMNTNPCQKQPAVNAELAALPSGDLLATMHPKIISKSSNYGGNSTWTISFQPNPEIIKNLFLWGFLSHTTSLSERKWVIDASELKQIKQGVYTTKTAQIWVSKSKPRSIRAIEIKFALPGGRSWHLLASVKPTPGVTPLKSLSLPKTFCQR